VKCGAATVRAANNGLATGEGFDATLRPHLEPDFRGMVRNHQTKLWAFGCTTCGYIELHVIDPGGLGFMQQQWLPVPPAAPPPPAPPPPTAPPPSAG
jgi:hypothetical protein